MLAFIGPDAKASQALNKRSYRSFGDSVTTSGPKRNMPLRVICSSAHRFWLPRDMRDEGKEEGRDSKT